MIPLAKCSYCEYDKSSKKMEVKLWEDGDVTIKINGYSFVLKSRKRKKLIKLLSKKEVQKE